MKNAWYQEHLTDGQSSPPFSFTYDGRPSAPLLAEWPVKVADERLDANRTRRTLTWTDPKTGLEVRCVAVDYADFPAVEWLLHFTNTGKSHSPIIAKIQALDCNLPGAGKGFVLHRALGESNSGLSFAPVDEPLPRGDWRERVFAPHGGRSSDGNMPYFNVDRHDGGMVLAIGWSGQWEAGFQPLADGSLRVRAGQQLTHFTLHAGETVRSPRIVLAFWQGPDDLRGNNIFRQLVLKHYLPQKDGLPVFPPICASTGEVAPDGTYEKPHLDAIAPMKERGIEVFWSDMDPQQWYPGGFPNGTGTWEVDTSKYPNGLKPLGDAIRAAGLGYLLWFEPERVHPGTKIDREHPEWVMKSQGEWSQLFRLHDEQAREWLTDLIDAHVTTAQLTWVRWDFNIEPLGFWRRNDAPDRQGITEIRHMEGLYGMWAELQRRHPGLIIDNCASGGRRLDIEAGRHGLPLWHSDLQCTGSHPEADQLQNGGLYRWVPLHGCGNFGLEPSYSFRSAMTPGNILCVSSTDPKTEEGMKKSVAVYRMLRPYMLGDFYPLFPHCAATHAWYGYQFHRPGEGDGVLLAFRRARCAGAAQVCRLRGLDPAARYAVTNFDADGATTLSTGRELMEQGLTVEITDQPFERLPPPEGNLDIALPAEGLAFGPFLRAAGAPPVEMLRRVPSELALGGARAPGRPFVFQDGAADLESLLANDGDVAFVYLPLTAPEAGRATFGFGADWWYEAYLDGAVISETLSSGNVSFPVTVRDHRVTVDLPRGEHLLVVRFVRGRHSAVLAVGGPRELRDHRVTAPGSAVLAYRRVHSEK